MGPRHTQTQVIGSLLEPWKVVHSLSLTAVNSDSQVVDTTTFLAHHRSLLTSFKEPQWTLYPGHIELTLIPLSAVVLNNKVMVCFDGMCLW